MFEQRAPALIVVFWLCLLLMLALGAPAVQAQTTPLRISDNTQTIAIPAPLLTLKEDQVRTPADWLQQPFTAAAYAASIPASPDFYWHKLELQADFPDDTPRVFYLAVDSEVLRYLEFYVFHDGQLADQQKAGLRDAPHRDHYTGIHIAIALEAGHTTTVLIRKQNDGPAIIPLQLLSESRFALRQEHQFMFWGAVIAVLAVLALYNALIYAMHPGPTYLWYLGFHSVTFIYVASLHGYGFWLWPHAMHVWLAQHIMMMNFLLLWLGLQFARVFLDARLHAPWHYRLRHWVTALCLPGAVIASWLPEYQMIPTFSTLQLVGTFFCLSMGFTALRNGFRPAIFFLMSWVFTALGGGIGIATFVGVIPVHFLTLHAFVLGAIAELILLSIALADRIKFIENKTLAQAFVDPQTNAPNFSFFKNRFPDQLAGLQHRYPYLFVLVIDLHGFRELVGLLGPDVLKQAYDRHVDRTLNLLRQKTWAVPIKTLQQDAFFITLPGGQEMLLVNTGSPAEASVQPMVKELLALSEQAITVNGINSKIGFRIGCAPFKPDQHSIFECFRQAQVALLTAHRNKRAFEIYASQQDIFIKHRLSLLSDLRLAITDETLMIYIQPQIRIEDGTLTGGEVLVRWQHPVEGFVSPGVFIPLAEQSQLIFDITRQVLQKACAWLQQQQNNLPEQFHLSVNLSALDINDNRLLPLIKHCIYAYNIPTRHLLFEVTESAVMDDPERFLIVIQTLHEMGFKIAIDDFGTGYSSMTYLQQMNADEIKIDIRFVRDIHTSETNQNIVKAIVQLARATGAYTVAEGVESDAELAILKMLNCDVAQGYLWAAALPAPVFVQQYLRIDEPARLTSRAASAPPTR